MSGIPFDGFETFPEYLRTLDGRIGVNAAFYVGHCAVRRYVMGDACQEREATTDEIDEMAAIVAESMEAGAAGFSSTHSPTHFDSAGRPVPSRFSSAAELERLVAAAGQAGRGGSIAYLPLSAVGGITPEDEALLVRLSLSARMPVVIQGLGARSKIDAPTAGWDNAKRFVDEATDQGAAVFSLAMSKPFNRTFDLATGTTMYEGALEFHRMFTDASDVAFTHGAAARSVVPRLHPPLGRQPQPRSREGRDAAAAALGRRARQQGDAVPRTRSTSAARSPTSPPSSAFIRPTR